MIESAVLDRPGTLVAAESALLASKQADAQTLELAAHWADLHSPDSLPRPVDEREARVRRLNGDYPVRPGGEGTPEVLASCLAELGHALETTSGGARHLVADALDLRHRLPRLWAEAVSGRVRAWRARQVAQATRRLPLEVMAEVDAGLVGLIPNLPWTRFVSILDATVKRAAPGDARADEEEAARRRFVAVGRGNEHGIATLIARGQVLDVQSFLAAVKWIADILALEGDTDEVDVRRSKAVGILAQPARALALLTLHADDPDHENEAEPAAPAAPEPAPDPDEPGRRHLGSDLLGAFGEAQLRQLASAGPRVQLYVHLTDAALTRIDPRGVSRVEGVGPITASTIRAWLRRPDLAVTVRPVAVPGEAIPVDAYEIPASTREAVHLRNPASVFPWAVRVSRDVDLDHVDPYVPLARGGPPGQTAPDNLGPLVRHEHRAKTSGRWQVRSPAPGVFFWRTPHGFVSLVTNQGTFPLGRGQQAHDLWRAAAPARPERRPSAETGSLVETYLFDLTSSVMAGAPG